MPFKKTEKQWPKPSQSAEERFARALRKVGRVSGHLVEAHVDGHKIERETEMVEALKRYSKVLEPWARSQAVKMLEEVSKKNQRQFKNHSKKIGRLLRENIQGTDIHKAATALMNEQVELIKSIPVRAAERAQKLAQQAFFNGTRADEISKELQRSGKVSESDADRIARTEVARSNTAMTQARSQAVGSTQYIWRNSGDESVREAHRIYRGKKLDGMVFSWDSPPTLDDGTTGHPGTFPNCRCYPEPFFPED